MSLKILLVFGTRPEAIKMAPLVKELNTRNNLETIVCVTAQHREMLDQVLEVFEIHPNYDLNIMQKGQTLSQITTRILNGMEEILEKEKPDIILVHGDTTTAYASALTAFYHRVKIGHVEAGLRTYNKYSPYPEEMNRQMIGVLCDYHFSPTLASAKNLLKEGKDEKMIFVTGNTAIDALRYTVRNEYHHQVLDWIGNDKMILLTAHRRENIGEPMRQMFTAIKRIVDEHKDIKVVYPIHMNPAVHSIANEIFKGHERIKIIDPLDVIDFHNFMAHSYLILTDSGGVQEEAPSLGKPVFVLRDTTERPEGVEAGTLKLVGTSEENIYRLLKEILADQAMYDEMAKASNPYGDGHASVRIADVLEMIKRV